MSRRPRDCCRVPDLFVMQQPLAQLLTIGSTTISIPQSIQPRCQIMLCLLCFNNQQRLMMLMKKIGFGCPVPGLAEVLGSPRTCARRWCEVQQSSNIFLVFFLKLFQKKILRKWSKSKCLNRHIPSAPGSWWKMWKRHLCFHVLHVLVLHQMHWHPVLEESGSHVGPNVLVRDLRLRIEGQVWLQRGISLWPKPPKPPKLLRPTSKDHHFALFWKVCSHLLLEARHRFSNTHRPEPVCHCVSLGALVHW